MYKFSRTNLDKPVPEESMRLNLGRDRGYISGTLNSIQYKDRDTKQFVIYIPTLELSGYGETIEKAKEMIDFVVQDYFQYLKSLGSEKAQAELSLLGFKQGIFKKQFSKRYIDDEAKFQHLNAENDQVERLLLTAA